MPTTRPRHLVTETDPVARALDAATRQWPGLSRSKLLLALIDEGHQSITARTEAKRAERLAAIEQTSGSLAGVFPDGYLEELRKDWPE